MTNPYAKFSKKKSEVETEVKENPYAKFVTPEVSVPISTNILEPQPIDIESPDGEIKRLPVQQSTPQLVQPESIKTSTPVESDEGVLKTVGQDLLDVAKGMVEGPASVASGIAGFLAGVPASVPTLLGGILAGEPVKGFEEARKESHKVMEAITYVPSTAGGQRIAEYAAMPFALAEDSIGVSVEAAGGTPEQAEAAKGVFGFLVFGLGGIKGLKGKGEIGTPRNYILNKIHEKFKRGVKLTAKDAKEISTVVPEVPKDTLKDILDKVNKLEEPTIAKFPENQSIVEALKIEVDKRTGPKRMRYNKALELVKEAEVDAKEIDLSVISKKEGKVRKLVKKLIEDREPKVETLTPELLPEIVEPTTEYKPIVKSGKDSIYLVDSKDRIESGYFNIKDDGSIEVSHKGFEDTGPIRPGRFEIDPEGRIKIVESPKYADIDITPIDVESGIKKVLEDTSLPVDRPIVETPEIGLSFTREQNIRKIRQDLMEKFRDRKKAQELRKTATGQLPPEVMEKSAQDMRDLAVKFAEYRKAKTEKINIDSKTLEELKESDLVLLEEDFASFKTPEELAEYMEASGMRGEVIQDPVTGRYLLEPDLKNLEDYSWEAEVPLERFDRLELEDYKYEGKIDTGEISDTGVKKLWDIINNESGAVDITPLRIHVDRLEKLTAKAKKLGKSPSEVLDMLGVDHTTAKKIVDDIAKLPQLQDEIHRADPINYEIFNPDPVNVVSQYAKPGTKGAIVYPAVTTEGFKKVWGAKKIDLPRSPIGKYYAATTIRMNSAARLGVKELLYDKWVVKRADAKREMRQVKEEMAELTKDLTKKEREDLSIYAYQQDPIAKAALESDGIYGEYELTAKTKPIYEIMRQKNDLIYDRVNYVRPRIGKFPVPKRDNYFTMIHRLAELEKRGIGENITQSSLSTLQAKESHFKGTFFPWEKPRKASNIPIEIDIFDAYERYMSRALEDIHVAPIAAQAKELANIHVKDIGLSQHNPRMHKWLNEWADEISGVDPITTMLNEKLPGPMRAYNILLNNLTASTLFGNVGTVIKQPLALRGVLTSTTPYDTAYGVMQMMKEKGLRKVGKSSKSNILEIRNMELILEDMAKNITRKGFDQGIMKGLLGVRDNFNMTLASFIQVVDGLTAEAGWNAGYSYAKRKLKLEDKEAFQYAEDLVARTQGVGVRGAVSPLQSVRALKFFTLFKTFANADFNFLTHDLMRIGNPAKIGRGKLAGMWIKYIVAGGLINSVFQWAGMQPPVIAPIDTYLKKREEGMLTGDATIEAMKEFLEIDPHIGGSLKYESNLAGPVATYLKDLPDAIGGVRYSLGWTLESLGIAVSNLEWYNMTDRQKLQVKLQTGKVIGQTLGVATTNQMVKSIRASSNGGDWYQTILGIYVEEAKGGPPKPPRFLDKNTKGFPLYRLR